MATILELAQFARAAYGGAIPATSDWQPLSDSPSNSLDYHGAAFINEVTKEIVITHRGTRPTSLKDLLHDAELTLHIATPAQKLAADYALSVAEKYSVKGYTIINTGHSLGGNEAQAAAIALQDQGIENTSAVTFNAPGIGGYAHAGSLASYNVLNLYAQGDTIHMAGGDHVGTSSKLEAGPGSSDFVKPLPLLALGVVGAVVIAGNALWQTVGAGHSIETLVSYLKWEDPEYGSTVWSSGSTAPAGERSEPSPVTLNPDGSLSLKLENVSVHAELDGDSVKTRSNYDINTTDAAGNSLSLTTDDKGVLDFILRDPSGQLVSERKLNADGTFSYSELAEGTMRNIVLDADGTITQKVYKANAEDDPHQDGTISSKSADGSLNYQTYKNGTLVSDYVVSSEHEVTSRTYDDSGKLTAQSHISSDGSSEGFAKVEGGTKTYHFDANGIGEVITPFVDGGKMKQEYRANHVLVVTTYYPDKDKPTVEEKYYSTSPSPTYKVPTPLPEGDKDGPGASLTDGTWSIASNDGLNFSAGLTIIGTYVKFSVPQQNAQYEFLNGQLRSASIDGVDVRIWDDGSLAYVGDYQTSGDGGITLSDGKTYYAPGIYGSYDFSNGNVHELYNDLGHTVTTYGWWNSVQSENYYNEAGQLISWRDGMGRLNERQDLADGGWSQTTYGADGIKTVQQYDVQGNLTGQAWVELGGGGSGSTVYQPDGGRVETNYQADGSRVDYIYTPDGRTTQKEYDVQGHLLHETWHDPYGLSGEISYFADGSRVSIEHNYGGTITQSYDSSGRLTHEKNEGWSMTQLTDYAEDGSSKGTITYQDGAHRIFENAVDGTQHVVGFDADGARTSEETSASDGTYTHRAWSPSGVLLRDESYDGTQYIGKEYSETGKLSYERSELSDGSNWSVNYNSDGTEAFRQWQHADGSSGAIEYRPGGLLVEYADQPDGSAHVVATQSDGSKAAALLGSNGNDTIIADAKVNFVAGGGGDDVLLLSGAHTVLAYGQGDGSDHVKGDMGTVDALSLSGVDFKEIALTRENNHLVMRLGSDESITFDDWYAAAATEHHIYLQLCADPDSGQGENPFDHHFERFDLTRLVQAYDKVRALDPTTTDWHVGASLQAIYLGGSNEELLGGAVAFSYAGQGNLGYYASAADAMQDPNFGLIAQSAYGGML